MNLSSICAQAKEEIKKGELVTTPLTMSNEVLGYDVSLFLNGQQNPISGGFAKDLETAKGICFAEAIERLITQKINLENPKLFNAEKDPTSAGYAFGLTPEFSKTRSTSEAYEFFVRFHLLTSKGSAALFEPQERSPVSTLVLSEFEQSLHYLKSDQILIDNKILQLHCLVLLGQKRKGLFWGIASGTETKGLGEKAAIEMYRNKKIFEFEASQQNQVLNKNRKRILKFGSKFDKKDIDFIHSYHWPKPKIEFQHILELPEKMGYLARTKIADVPSWDQIPTESLA